MFGAEIPEGALYFISSHRRLPVVLDDALRSRTRLLAGQLHTLRQTLSTPPAEYSAKCRRCSLLELCAPKVKASAAAYCTRLRREAVGEIEGEPAP